MRRLPRVALVLAPALLIAALPAAAQYGGGRGARRSDSARPEVAASTESALLPQAVAALVLARGGDLQLDDKQLALIESVRRAQDSANRPWRERLDSLRNGPRPLNPRDLSQEQRDVMASQRAATTQALAAMRETNAGARERVMAVLTPDQQQKAAVLEDDAQKRSRDDGQRRGRPESGGMQRQRED